MIHLTEKKLKTYSFDSLYSEHTIRVDTVNRMIKQGIGKKEIRYNYLVKDSLTLEFYYTVFDEEKSENKMVTWRYKKLIPTQINYSVAKFRKKRFHHFYSSSFTRPSNEIKLSGLMCSSEVEKIRGKESCKRYRLEKIDKTYFVVYYWKENNKQWMFPVAEINEDHMLIYGVPEKKEFVRLNEIK
ncbi:hypothetical protein HN014_06675 [Aquimarina sp. TRL1]|uniref:hypothetical protein n=1 Tax=Aquimarina sp. (strain TRL1) TaxID=2736252 RepID=UPI00158CCA6D|nr:hypothetical protein [Aquimarina sp. TRL1]QKX04608.1 hypothetical protein HN014_06675 [Aquimarina sp. TRL1]